MPVMATPPTSHGRRRSAAWRSTPGRCARTTSTTPTSCGWTSTPCRRSVRRRAPRRDRRQGRARGARARRFPKTSGKKGIHVNARIRPEWTFTEVEGGAPSRARSSAASPTSRRRRGGRRSATACSSTTTRTRATGPWRPRTACARSDARVSAAHLGRGPRRRTGRVHDAHGPRPPPTRGRRRRGARGQAGSLEAAFELATQQEAEGLGEAPYPPHFPKAEGEPVRAQPSRRRKRDDEDKGTVPPPAPGRRADPGAAGRRCH